MTKKYKRIPVNRYAFPKKIRIVRHKTGPRKKSRIMKRDAYEAFCEWSAKPTPMRDGKYLKDFALKWGVSVPTLVDWKKKQEFWERVAEWRINWARDKTSDVVHGLFKRASTRGEAAEVKLWMQLIEDWSERVTQTAPNITVIGIRGITQEDLEKLTKPPEKLNEKGVVQEAEVVEN